MGLRLSLGHVARLGGAGLVVVVVTVAVTFLGTLWLGRRLGLSPELSLLIGCGFAICGASAIVAVKDATWGRQSEVTMAIALVTPCGSLAVVALPVMAALVGVDGPQFGAWAGASVHDVVQVVATASTGGAAALSYRRGRETDAGRPPGTYGGGPEPALSRAGPRAGDGPWAVLPAFVAGFLAMALLRSADMLSESVVDAGRVGEGVLLTAALVGLGDPGRCP